MLDALPLLGSQCSGKLNYKVVISRRTRGHSDGSNEELMKGGVVFLVPHIITNEICNSSTDSTPKALRFHNAPDKSVRPTCARRRSLTGEHFDMTKEIEIYSFKNLLRSILGCS